MYPAKYALVNSIVTYHLGISLQTNGISLSSLKFNIEYWCSYIEKIKIILTGKNISLANTDLWTDIK